MGMLADKFSRKKLLAIGLFINGLGFVGLALAPNYPIAILSVLLAGFGGSFYHPAATALIAGLFPLNPGRALGLTGIGAAVGFCPRAALHPDGALNREEAGARQSWNSECWAQPSPCSSGVWATRSNPDPQAGRSIAMPAFSQPP